MLDLNKVYLPLKIKACVILVIIFLLSNNTVLAQLAVPFAPRLTEGNIKVKGDVVLIGNSIITGKGLKLPYNGSGDNNSYEGAYIDVDGDGSTFSSSTANLLISNSCKKIVYAGLYWASIYPNEVGTNSSQFFTGTQRLNDWNQVKFKLPTGGYLDLSADNNADPAGDEDAIIFDGYNHSNINQSFKDSPIICYKNVTGLLQGLTNADGTYTLANLRATTGKRNGGCAGGWTLVVIYESPTLPNKFISTFDGYAGVQSTTSLDIPVSGFKTLPAPFPVNAKIGVSALEGDLDITGDSFQFKASTSAAFTVISDALNPATNFFNSTISNLGTQITNRNPTSTNTLGYDIDNVKINNPLNGVLPNNSTAGALKLTTSGDGYGAFVTTFSVDIIEPNILLTKQVQDITGNDIGNTNVVLGQELYYNIGFQNIGNDDAISFTIKDKLPININFNPADIIIPNGSGITFNYNATTREIIFTIPDNLVNINDPRYELEFKVQVVANCNELSDACSDKIQNQAYATYRGLISPNQITDDPSLSSFNACNLGTPSTTNFLVGVDGCQFTKSVILCGATADLVAANGYSEYSWSTSPTGSPVIGTNQTLTVTQPGTYYVHNTAVAPCLSIDQKITVSSFGTAINNPIIPFADQVVTCPNNGKKLPNIFLCGANSTRLIRSGISDAISIVWEKLNEASCTAVTNSDCANESTACTWDSVGTGPDYTASTSGQFRMTINYAGGCFNRFYFNVYQNLLNPTVTTKDIICNTQGEITVGGVPAGYEYSLDNITYQASNVFPITTQNSYTVFIKQIGISSFPCIFSVPGIQIRKRDFTVSTFITQPYCNGGKGSVKLAANDVQGQYYYKIYQGATLINEVGPIAASDYTFSNLNAGTLSSPITYTWDVSTEDGCHLTGTVDLMEPAVLTATAALTVPLTCIDGEITVTPVGGTPPFSYFVNSATDFQSIPQIVVSSPLPAGGIYNVTVVDNNNCTTTTSIKVDATLPPVYTIAKTDALCSGSSNTVN